MKKRLGVIGGGQLGMMITEAAKNLSEYISEIIVLDPTENCPAAQAGAKQIVGDFKDEIAILKLAEQSDIITYEIESGNTDVLSKLKAEIEPSPSTLGIKGAPVPPAQISAVRKSDITGMLNFRLKKMDPRSVKWIAH